VEDWCIAESCGEGKCIHKRENHQVSIVSSLFPYVRYTFWEIILIAVSRLLSFYGAISTFASFILAAQNGF
jgi:hypothetical protein